MAGNRKFALNYITRDDIAALTKPAAEISGIPYILDVDKDEVAEDPQGLDQPKHLGTVSSFDKGGRGLLSPFRCF